MKKINFKFGLILLCAVNFFASGVYAKQSRHSSFSAFSPDGRNEVRLELGENGIKYSVWRRGKAMLKPVNISLRIKDKKLLNGKGLTPTVTKRAVNGKISTPNYKKSFIDLAANETRVWFGEWGIRLHSRNDGVAWRFETDYPDEIYVTAENTAVKFPEGTELCYSQVGSFATSFENPCRVGLVESVKPGHPQIVITPFTASVPAAGVVTVTESNLLDYPGLNFYRVKKEKDVLRSWQAGLPSETVRKGRWIRVKKRFPYLAKTKGKRLFPWRVFVLGDEPSALVSSDIVYAIAEESRLKDVSWIKPGLVQWDWWHGFKITDVPGLKTGCNFETYKAYVDFAAQNRVRYIIMDEGWSEKLNLDKPRESVNVAGVIKYGEKKGVNVILWAAWSMLSTKEDRERIFSRYSAMGAKGFKIDFMDRDDQMLERFLEETAADAAKYKLVVMYHGIHKPTGLQRTYPNILNYEGVYGLEQGHSRGGKKVVLANDVNIVYTRMVAGFLDYTPGAMRNRSYDAPPFVKGNSPSACYGTRCHQLALFPIFEAPVQMMCDSPTQYRTAPECTSFLTKVPTVWDETCGVLGEINKFAVVARRKGDKWWLGAITNWDEREMEIPTAFLGSGNWEVEAFEDAEDSNVDAENFVCRKYKIKAGDKIKVRLARGGGFAACFSRAP
jgi:alpha-glucosidase